MCMSSILPYQHHHAKISKFPSRTVSLNLDTALFFFFFASCGVAIGNRFIIAGARAELFGDLSIEPP